MLSGGIRRGEVVLIAARPKVGKTGLALAIARNVAESANVLLLEMEMPRAQLHDRNMAALARVSLSRLLDPNRMDSDDWNRITAALGRMERMGLFVDDKAGLRMIDVRNKARRVKRRHGLDLLVIDYLQLMEADGDNRNAQIESITRGIKSLAKELNIGVLLLSQLNREVEKRQDKRPLPSDLRDSGSIEQDCDVGLFLYRDEIYREDSPDAGIVEVNIGLNRHGSTGTVGLAYIGDQARFESLPHGTVFGRARRDERRPVYSGLRD
jgi:replicative DNA helicase